MKYKSLKGEATIRCTVFRGMFSSEWILQINLPGGRNLVAFVDKRQVLVNPEPQEEGMEQEGRVKVSIVEMKGNSILLDLPQPTLTTGTRLRVPRSFVEWVA